MLVSRTAGGDLGTIKGKFGPSCATFHLLVSRTAGGHLDTQNGRMGGNSICWFQEQQAGTLTLKMGGPEETSCVGFKNSRRGP